MTKWVIRVLFIVGMAILVLPIVVVVINAFNANELLSGWGGFTFHWVAHVFADQDVRQATVGSFVIGGISTAVSTVIGTLVVGFAAYSPGWARRVTGALTISRIMLPEVVLAAGLIVLMPRIGIRFSTTAVVLGHIVWCSAYFIAIAGARRAGFDRTLEDAARDLGAPPFRVFRTIVVPDLVPGLVAGAVVAFMFSFDDVVTSTFLSGPDTNTLPLDILSRIHHGISPTINAIGLFIMIVMTVCLTAVAALGGIRFNRRLADPVEVAAR